MTGPDPPTGFLRHHRPLVWLGVAGLIVAIAAGGAIWYFIRADRQTPITAEEAVAAFQEASIVSLGQPDPNARPGDPGVYSYTTVGYEEVNALGGSRHDYPAETFITLRPGECGSTIRWDALVERWEEEEVCEVPALAGFISFHRWFGVDDRGSWSCAQPEALTTGDRPTWTFECTTGKSVEEYRVERVGMEQVAVDGEPYDAVHFHVETSSSGRTSGTGTTDTWWLPGTDLILKRTWVNNSVTASPLGDVRYFEQVELVLNSPVPVG